MAPDAPDAFRRAGRAPGGIEAAGVAATGADHVSMRLMGAVPGVTAPLQSILAGSPAVGSGGAVSREPSRHCQAKRPA